MATSREILKRAAVGHRRPLLIASALFAGHQAGEALVPVLVGVVIDRAVDGGTVGALVAWLGVLVADFLVLSVCWRFGIRFSLRGALLAEHEARVAVTARVLDARGGAESTRLPGALAALANGDTRRLGLLNHALPNIAAAVTAVLVGGGALLLISVPLGLLVLLGAPVLLGLITVLGRPLERRNADQLAEVAGSAGLATDMVTGVRVLKGLGAEAAAIERYAAVSRRSLRAAVSAGRAMGGYRASALVANGLFLAVVAYVGARLALDGQLSPGELVSAVGLGQFLLEPLSLFGAMSVLVAQARASSGRIAEVHATPYAIDAGGAEPVDGPGRLELRGVVHGPFTGLDLHVGAGEHVAVVAQAADATALLDLLARRADPTAGTVAVDGVPLPAAGLDALRRAVLVADHDGELFEGSVRDNVGLRAVDPGRVAAAMAAAGADQVVEVLVDGADAAVGERGRALSGGQRQRVALARALAADPAVLVLHDPTTAVDSVTETGVAAGIDRVRRGRSTLVVTTSPVLLATADRVLVLRDGAVVATGTHDELLRTDSDYRGQVLS